MKGDRAIESGADKLEQLSDKAAAKGGVTGKLACELADDASFLRRSGSCYVRADSGRVCA